MSITEKQEEYITLKKFHAMKDCIVKTNINITTDHKVVMLSEVVKKCPNASKAFERITKDFLNNLFATAEEYMEVIKK